MNLGKVKIKFDEEQLKRFEDAADRLATFVDGRDDGDETKKGCAASVSIQVPVCVVPDAPPFTSFDRVPDLTDRQGVALRGLLAGLISQGARVKASGLYPVVNDCGAISWLLDQIADQMESQA